MMTRILIFAERRQWEALMLKWHSQCQVIIGRSEMQLSEGSLEPDRILMRSLHVRRERYHPVRETFRSMYL